jgi:cyanophycin synthetase
LVDPINTRMDGIWRWIEPVVGPYLYKHFIPGMLRFFVVVHLGTRADNPDENTGGRAKAFWDEAKKRGIGMWEFRLLNRGREVFVATWKGEDRAFDGLPRPGNQTSASLLWMDNKGIMREKFQAAGIPVANGGVSGTWWKTKKIFTTLVKPVIIKPNLGSRSRHTTTHIETEAELKKAYDLAKQLSPWIVIEEEHKGLVYRATVIGGKLEGVLRREPPCVYGDGTHTIEELIAIENKNPLRQGPIFHTIVVSDLTTEELKKQHIGLTDIPQKDQLVTDVTDETHPDNKKVFEYVAEVLADPLVGIDFMISDISKSWKEEKRSGVIECNSLPFIDLHLFPLHGKSRNISSALWDLVWPDSNPDRK